MGRPKKNEMINKLSQEEMNEKAKDIAISNLEKTNTSRYDFLNDNIKFQIRNALSSFQDAQKLRIATGNRLVQSLNIQMGQEPSTSQEEMDSEAQKLIEIINQEYTRITDAYADEVGVKEGKLGKKDESIIGKIIERLNTNSDQKIKMIRDATDYNLVRTYNQLLNIEKEYLGIIENLVLSHPMWDAFFKDVKGCGVTIAAYCLAYLDVNKARHRSCFWQYAGVGMNTYLAEDGSTVRMSQSKSRTIDGSYIDKETGKESYKKTLGYNPDLQKQLLGVMCDVMNKACGKKIKMIDPKTGEQMLDEKGKPMYVLGPDGKPLHNYEGYMKVYQEYYARISNPDDYRSQYNALHRMKMARRHMVKIFLEDMWVKWRTLAGYEIEPAYPEAFLNKYPHGYNQADVTKEEYEKAKAEVYAGYKVKIHGNLDKHVSAKQIEYAEKEKAE